MMDRRLLPANDRVAATHLSGKVDAPLFTDGVAKSVTVPIVDLMRDPAGPRERQLLLGQNVTEYEMRDGISFVQSHKDGFVGYLPSACLGPAVAPTHKVAVRASHFYAEADLKSPDRAELSFGACVEVSATDNAFSQTAFGWVPSVHLVPLDHLEKDLVSVAERFLGTPYLWGGNGAAGLDCSGLVQAALLAGGISCPGDSDQQEQALGDILPPDAPLIRGDLIFWKGHVAIVVAPDWLVHANAHHMAVAYEQAQDAIARIAGEGSVVTSRKRFR